MDIYLKETLFFIQHGCCFSMSQVVPGRNPGTQINTSKVFMSFVNISKFNCQGNLNVYLYCKQNFVSKPFILVTLTCRVPLLQQDGDTGFLQLGEQTEQKRKLGIQFSLYIRQSYRLQVACHWLIGQYMLLRKCVEKFLIKTV